MSWRWLSMAPLLCSLACSAGVNPSGHDDDGGFETTASTSTGADSGETSPGTGATTKSDEGHDDTNGDDDRPPPELAEVAHERELRGAWIASLGNINFPSASGLSVAQMQQEIDALIELAASLKLNALFFQVRPESDALYASALEPWSRYLTGTQGADPGFDPLAYFIERAHPRGIEVHAWLNPYRAAANVNLPRAATHVASEHPQYAYRYGTNLLWMDPGAEPVMQNTIDVTLDIVTRYDVDGIHLDDYFYPYPVPGVLFVDGDTYQAYVNAGGTLSGEDWRRDNVNRLVKRLHDEIAATKPWVRFGISPFGIYRDGVPQGTSGLDQYEQLFADPVKWMQEGWVDYLAPQLYWATTAPLQRYETLVDWWVSITPPGRNLFVGNGLHHLASAQAWPLDEIRQQINLSREYQVGSLGNIHYHIAFLQQDTRGVATMLTSEFYTQRVLPPVMWERADDALAHPKVTVSGRTVTLAPRDDTPLRGWAVYRDIEGTFELHDVVFVAASNEVTLGPGRWAISAVARSGVESEGVVVEIDG